MEQLFKKNQMIGLKLIIASRDRPDKWKLQHVLQAEKLPEIGLYLPEKVLSVKKSIYKGGNILTRLS